MNTRLSAAPTETQGGAKEEELSEAAAHMESFSRALARWHRACAQLETLSDFDEDDEKSINGCFVEERSALRGLFLVPALDPEVVWTKLAAFEVELVKERIAGEPKDSVLLFGLGSIKADLMNLGIARGDI
jgi:hypothetical protein